MILRPFLFFRFLAILISAIVPHTIQAQESNLPNSKELRTLPLTSIVNFEVEEAIIGDFADKLLILDYYTTWCVPCIQKFPKLNELQKKYNDEIQIMPYSHESKELIQKLFTSLKKQGDYILPSVSQDIELWKTFNNDQSFDKAYIWIHKGKLIANTSDVKESTIRAILDGSYKVNSTITSSLKNFPNSFEKPMLKPVFGTYSKKSFSSSLTTYQNGYRSMPQIKGPDKENRISGLRYINLPLSKLYLEAYQMYPSSQVSYEMDDKSHFDPIKNTWDRTNLYCYELIMQDKGIGELRTIMQEDLERVFGYQVSKQIRPMKTIILSGNGNNRLKSKIGKQGREQTNFYLYLTNTPFPEFVKRTGKAMIGRNASFIVDETGYKGNIDIKLDANFDDPKAVAKALEPYGLQLIIEERPTEVYVISNPKQ